MDKIQSAFSNNPKYLRLQKPLQAAQVCDTARSLSDSRFDVVSFKQGLLTLAVKTPAEMFNLQMESQKIIDSINRELKKDQVERIRFKIK